MSFILYTSPLPKETVQTVIDQTCVNVRIIEPYYEGLSQVHIYTYSCVDVSQKLKKYARTSFILYWANCWPKQFPYNKVPEYNIIFTYVNVLECICLKAIISMKALGDIPWANWEQEKGQVKDSSLCCFYVKNVRD